MGRILTHVTIVNALDPAREVSCQALVDTGAWSLMLPRAWKERLGAFQMTRTVEMVTADQRVVSGEVCGPVTVRIEGFEPISSEVTFVDMEPEGGRYRPLLGYDLELGAGRELDELPQSRLSGRIERPLTQQHRPLPRSIPREHAGGRDPQVAVPLLGKARKRGYGAAVDGERGLARLHDGCGPVDTQVPRGGDDETP